MEIVDLNGRKGLVVGIANEHSLVWWAAKHFASAGAEGSEAGGMTRGRFVHLLSAAKEVRIADESAYAGLLMGWLRRR